MDFTEAHVDELLALWVEEQPEPVDVFEDGLMARLGLHRHPATPLGAWRRLRVATLDSLWTRESEA